MIFLSLLGLVTRYIYFKFVFIRYCRIPKAYGLAMVERAEGLLPITLILHILFSIWMLGVRDIFLVQEETFVD